MRAHLSTLSLVLIVGLACDPGSEDADPRISGCIDQRSQPGQPGKPGHCDDGGEPEDGEVCGYRTETQAAWGAACNGKKTAACFRDEHFPAVFPEGLYVGCGEFTANLLTSAAVEASLPSAGMPRALLLSEAVAYDGDADPEVTTSLFGEAVALSLNIDFEAVPEFHTSSPAVPLAELVLAEPSACAGLTVGQLLDEANTALAGCPAAFTPAVLDGCIAAVNASFTGTKGKKIRCSDLFEPTMP